MFGIHTMEIGITMMIKKQSMNIKKSIIIINIIIKIKIKTLSLWQLQQ